MVEFFQCTMDGVTGTQFCHTAGYMLTQYYRTAGYKLVPIVTYLLIQEWYVLRSCLGRRR